MHFRLYIITIGMLTSMISFFFSSKAHAQVESTAYSLMLKTLLSHSVPELSVAEAKKLTNVQWIDAREKNEFEVSHIVNAIWIGYNTPHFDALDGITKDAPIVVYCSVGYRSEKIAETLQKKGFTKVFNLYGGLFEWVNQGNPVVSTQQHPTQKVHAYSKAWGIWLNKGEKVY
jgi:rhodanese-related sulfurtransferase